MLQCTHNCACTRHSAEHVMGAQLCLYQTLSCVCNKHTLSCARMVFLCDHCVNSSVNSPDSSSVCMDKLVMQCIMSMSAC